MREREGVSGVESKSAITVNSGCMEGARGGSKVARKIGGVSFRDKVLEGEVVSFPRFFEEDIQAKVKLSFKNGDSRRLMVFFEDKLVAKAVP